MGSKPRSYSLLREMLRANQAPLVLDADALTLYGEKPFPLHTPTILTPHLGELQRLMQLSHKPRLSPIFLASVQKFAEKIGATIIVKGMPTYVVHPGKSIYCSSVGNPGMATAGSGDVLAGIVAALLAQGLEPQQAALLGVYLHGTAGDAAAAELSPYCMMASDIIAHLPGVFKELGGLGCVSP
jgi:NAD(P)H-hydrate epimerase